MKPPPSGFFWSLKGRTELQLNAWICHELLEGHLRRHDVGQPESVKKLIRRDRLALSKGFGQRPKDKRPAFPFPCVRALNGVYDAIGECRRGFRALPSLECIRPGCVSLSYRQCEQGFDALEAGLNRSPELWRQPLQRGGHRRGCPAERELRKRCHARSSQHAHTHQR